MKSTTNQPTTYNQQLTTNNLQQTTYNKQLTTDNQQQTTENKQPTTNNKPTTNSRKLITENSQPTTNNQQLTPHKPIHIKRKRKKRIPQNFEIKSKTLMLYIPNIKSYFIGPDDGVVVV